MNPAVHAELGVIHYIFAKMTAMQRRDKIFEQFEFTHDRLRKLLMLHC